jgi:hypothetical protein
MTHYRSCFGLVFANPSLASLESFLLYFSGVTHLIRELTRFVPDRDTITEVVIVLGIVLMFLFLSKTNNLQSIARQVSPYSSEASPAISQK